MYIHTPIITASDCEGAGEMFQVTTVLPPANESISKMNGKLLERVGQENEEEKKDEAPALSKNALKKLAKKNAKGDKPTDENKAEAEAEEDKK